MTDRIAMWSGPRNISTALMRSFESRTDAHVSDEPLYASYLRSTGLPHPLAAEIVATHESDWRKVVEELTGPVPGGREVWYQKHMAHHMVDTVPRDWLTAVENAFLIRDPREMVTSLIKVIPEARLADTGLPQQLELFELVCDTSGEPPPVLDSRDVLENPEDLLQKLCTAVGLAFETSMLEWPAGRRSTDGVWAPHWYHAVHKSTGFKPYLKKQGFPVELVPLLQECQPWYDKLFANALRARPKGASY